MGLWSKLIGLGTAGVGLATSNPYLIGAGASIFAGGQQADAAKDAAKQQQEAAQKAEGRVDQLFGDARTEIRGVHDQTQANFAPYIQLGHGTLGNLGAMVGLERTAAPAPMPAATPYTPQSLGAMAEPQGRPVVDPEGLRPQQALLANASGYGKNPDRGEAMAGRGLVRVEAPDGESRWMPRRLADEYVARGARILG